MMIKQLKTDQDGEMARAVLDVDCWACVAHKASHRLESLKSLAQVCTHSKAGVAMLTHGLILGRFKNKMTLAQASAALHLQETDLRKLPHESSFTQYGEETFRVFSFNFQRILNHTGGWRRLAFVVSENIEAESHTLFGRRNAAASARRARLDAWCVQKTNFRSVSQWIQMSKSMDKSLHPHEDNTIKSWLSNTRLDPKVSFEAVHTRAKVLYERFERSLLIRDQMELNGFDRGHLGSHKLILGYIDGCPFKHFGTVKAILHETCFQHWAKDYAGFDEKFQAEIKRLKASGTKHRDLNALQNSARGNVLELMRPAAPAVWPWLRQAQ